MIFLPWLKPHTFILFNRVLVVLSVFFVSFSVAKEVNLAAGDFKPYTAEELVNGGVLTEVVNQAFKRMDYQVKTEFLPWKRAYNDAKNARNDGTFPWSRNAEREGDFYFSAPLYTFKRMLFVLQDSPIKATRLEDLTGLRVCRAQGYSIQGIKDMVSRGELTHEAPPDMEACFRMLAAKRVDGVVSDQLEGWANVETVLGSRAKVRMLGFPVYQYTNHLLISKQHPEGKQLIEIFNQGLAKFIESGDFDALIKLRLEQE